MELPTGTVTFVFTDIAGSTRLWEDHAAAMGAAVEEAGQADVLASAGPACEGGAP